MKYKQFDKMLINHLRFNQLMNQLYSDDHSDLFNATVKKLEMQLSDNLSVKINREICGG